MQKCCFASHRRGTVSVMAVSGTLSISRKTAVVHLLHPAHAVQMDGLHGFGIAQICHMWVVKGNVPVFSNSHADDVDWRFVQQRRVSRAFGL